MKITTLEEYQKLHDSDVETFSFYVSASRIFLSFKISRDGKSETFAVPFAQIPSVRLELGSQPGMTGRRYYGSIIFPSYHKNKQIVRFNMDPTIRPVKIEPDDDIIYPAPAVDDRIWLGTTIIYTPAGEGISLYNRIMDET